MKCKICGKEHIFKNADDLTPNQRRNLDTKYHHTFIEGFVGCLIKEDQVIEYYEALSKLRIEIDLRESEEKKKKTQEEEYEEVLDSSTEEDFGTEDG
jgi:hypothetical protein